MNRIRTESASRRCGFMAEDDRMMRPIATIARTCVRVASNGIRQTVHLTVALLQTCACQVRIGAVAPLISDHPTQPNHSHTVQSKLKVQLSIFMFLQYFIWGAW